MIEFVFGLLVGRLLGRGPTPPPAPLPGGRACRECVYYETMMRDDPHFAPQHYQAKMNHRLYGVCSDRRRKSA